MHKSEELKAAFRAALEASGLPSTGGLSVGCAEVGPGITDVAPALREADERMYEDKRAAQEVRRGE